MHSKKCFGKYFLVFGCIVENTLETPSFSCSNIFLGSKQILLQRIKIYKQHKKQKSKQKIKITRPIVREGQRKIGLWVWLADGRGGSIWRWWVDLGVGHSLGGSIGSWVCGTISPVLGCDSSVLGCAIRALIGAWMCDRRGVHVREDGEYCRTMWGVRDLWGAWSVVWGV